ncbi:hypothetical protein NP493_2077g00003 [Ridgeia piscesae]|uniref:Uncharacterized protein n=1 Tax=Ridgeia piscesae TaxID=27915 RepID=A0AAD9JNQ6_RIDPI|nr:hypothetical protein NP493_2077g00003 [Ridgeia piscesae]
MRRCQFVYLQYVYVAIVIVVLGFGYTRSALNIYYSK